MGNTKSSSLGKPTKTRRIARDRLGKEGMAHEQAGRQKTATFPEGNFWELRGDQGQIQQTPLLPVGTPAGMSMPRVPCTTA